MTAVRRDIAILVHRDELNRRLTGLKAGADGSSPGEVVRDLAGTGRLWWDCCREAVAADPQWLAGDEASAVLALIAAHASGTADERRAVADGAMTTLLVAQSLAASDNERQAVLEGVIGRWSTAGALPPRPSGAGLLGREGVAAAGLPLRPRLEALVRTLERLGDDPVRAIVALTALQLAGEEKRSRYVVRMSVVFGTPGDNGAEKGAAGTLELDGVPPREQDARAQRRTGCCARRVGRGSSSPVAGARRRAGSDRGPAGPERSDPARSRRGSLAP